MVALVVAVLVVLVLVGAGPRRRRPRRRRPRRRPGPLSIRLRVPYFLDPTRRRQRTTGAIFCPGTTRTAWVGLLRRRHGDGCGPR